jgi:hypothetical protein
MAKRTIRVEAGPGSQRWSDHDARSALSEQAKSGMTAEDFAEGKGYSAQRLTYWKKRLSASPAVSFVPVELPVAAMSTPAPRHIEISCDAVVIRVREDLDVEHVARIALALTTAGRARRC